jgi:hypothetical protein
LATFGALAKMALRMMNWRLIQIVGLTLASGLLAAPVRPLGIEQLSRAADFVLHGTVLSRSYQRDEAGRIYTRIEFKVEEVWKGRHGQDRFVIVHSGGVSGRERLTVLNQVQFEVGEEAVVFLVRNARDEGVCVGMAQGKFRIWRDASTGEKLAIPGFAEVAVGGELTATRPPVGKPLTLAQLKQRVCGGQP